MVAVLLGTPTSAQPTNIASKSNHTIRLQNETARHYSKSKSEMESKKKKEDQEKKVQRN